MRALHVVHAQGRGVLRITRRRLWKVAGREATVAAPPGATSVLGQPHAGGRDRNCQAVGIARPGADRVQAQAATAGLPLGPRGLVPQPLVDLPAGAAVMALEQHAGVGAHIQRSGSLTRGYHPDALERLVPTFRERHALGLLPLGSGVAVRVEQLRTVERRGDGGEQSPAARVAQCVIHRLAGKRAGADLEAIVGAAARLALEQEQSLLGPDHQLRHPQPPVIAGITSTRAPSGTSVCSSPRSPLTNTLM